MNQGRGHPDAEVLAQYVDGVLEQAEREEVERHLVECPDCRDVITDAAADCASDAAPATPAPIRVHVRSRFWMPGLVSALAAAAALVLIVRVVRPDWFEAPVVGPDRQALIAAVAHEPTRLVEGRLTGGFVYGPPPSPTRGTAVSSQHLLPATEQAVEQVIARTPPRSTPQNDALIGVANLLAGQRNEAVEALDRAVARSSGTSVARIRSDLATAYLAKAQIADRPQNLQNALDAADAALREDPTLAEALFARALALEGLDRRALARAAWERYLQQDASSKWAEEAKQHLAALTQHSDR